MAPYACVPVQICGQPQAPRGIRITYPESLLWVHLDAGCGSALQCGSGRVTPRLSGGPVPIGLTKISTPVVPTTVELGTERRDAVPTRLQQREMFPGESGLLRNDLLSRLRVTIDASRGHVVLE